MDHYVAVAALHEELADLGWRRCRARGRPVEGHNERQWRSKKAGCTSARRRRERVRDEVYPPNPPADV